MKNLFKLMSITLTFSLFTSCFQIPNEESSSSDDHKESEENEISGSITMLLNKIIPSAHASENDGPCSSDKSNNSTEYVELYEITDESVLGTDQESSGLSKLCDADVLAGHYHFDVESEILGDKPLKIKVFGGDHEGKEIITTAKNDDHDIDIEKTVQTSLIQKDLRENPVTFSTNVLKQKLNHFRKDIIENILQSNSFNADPVSLKGMVDIFDEFISALPANPSNNDFTLDLSQLANVSLMDKCFMITNSDSSLDPQQTCSGLKTKILLVSAEISNQTGTVQDYIANCYSSSNCTSLSESVNDLGINASELTSLLINELP